MTRRARLAPDPEKVEELLQLRERLAAAKVADRLAGDALNSTAPDLERQVKELEAAVLQTAPVYLFRQLSRREKADIVRKYPPNVEQWQRYREKVKAYPGYILDAPEFDMVASAPEVLHLAATDPTLTLTEAEQLWDEVSDSDAATLWQAAWEDDKAPPFYGTGTDTTRSSGPDSTTPASTESL